MQLKLLCLIMMVSKNIMYGVLIQIFLFSILLADDLNAQVKTIKDIHIQMESGDYDLKNIFLEIEKRTDLKFAYPDRILDSQGLIRIASKKQSVYDLLSNISKVAKLQFKQVNEVVYVGDAADKIPTDQKISIIIQTRTVTGKVTSQEDREGLPGVNVIERGTNNGTVTDVQGDYSLQVSEGAVLVFSSVGYTREEVTVGNRSVVDLVMTQDIQQLDELVVVGYGTMQKRHLTGSVGSVQMDETLESRPMIDFGQACMARLPVYRCSTQADVRGNHLGYRYVGSTLSVQEVRP
jgi:TonB-dependent starch-binding outer membrane protein SusC